ncbi:ABC transporter ATP-binding protein [Sporomusa acidovorans]|uniref:ABC transporter ATP-binding protein n=1 Tax=Sporomusa acidovorans (strain ATCC 49682 / DSM 3132 / Mol) TaxID=1123286 RepID=A0ABZ3J5Y6_SPOA4|nr:ABC transporter ATP-binding protein [Sporomusa acidovorans]OZC15405.1 putative ABC transporter ATP-binding protein [Sporomusa acidovorans DSM 3132]SDF13247.1 iron complex transport system ATP-binding protein [Sporomusa acidovorans]
MFAVENISFGYPSSGSLLTDLSFTINKGDVACLLGPNGAGKTTLLRCLLGINKVQSGSIKIKGRRIGDITAKELACAMAYVPQAATTVFPHRVLDIVVMGRTPHVGFTAVPTDEDYAMAEESLAELGISHLADCQFSRISGGERQLTLIARALTQRAELFIMDEPTSSLDYGNQVRILRVIDKLAKQGYSIIMTSHFPNHAFLLCNKVLIMKNGKITAMGTPEEVVTDQILSELYTTKVRIVELDDGVSDKLKVCVPMLT